MRQLRGLAFQIFLLLLIHPFSSYAADSASENPKVLLVHSYHAEYAWTDGITRGVQEVLRGKPLQLEIVYLDGKRRNDSVWKEKRGAEIRKKIQEWKPGVVIAADDDAQTFVTQYFVSQLPYFVFCGVNEDPSVYGFPASNVTGILARPRAAQSLQYLREVLGPSYSLRRFAFLADRGATSIGAFNFIRKQHEIDGTVIAYALTNQYDRWKDRVKEFDRDADTIFFYTYHTLQSGSSPLSLEGSEVMKWTIENIKRPSIGFFDFTIEQGVLCGVVSSAEEHGREAAGMALQILNGTKPDMIPIRQAKEGKRMLNLKTARQLGIQVSESVLKSTDKVFDS